MDGKKRKILGAAALSALTLFTGCKATELETKPAPTPEKEPIIWSDTSEITAQNMYDKYVESFEAGNTTYIKNEIEGLINEKYDMLMEVVESQPTTDEWGMEVESPLKTYNFDGTEFEYDNERLGNYYIGDESVKYIGANYVKIKTENGYFGISKDSKEGSYTIDNVDKKNSVSTKIVYNADKSSTIEEITENGSLTLEFNNDGTIKSAENYDNKSNTTIKQFEDGNVDVYKMYDKYEQLLEKHKKDGSYYVIEHKLDKDRYNYDIWTPQGSVFTYNYDKNDNLKDIDLTAQNRFNDGGHATYEGKLMPNGDSYMYTEVYDSENSLASVTKTEQIYNKMRNEVSKSYDKDGTEHTLVTSYDYTKLNGHQYIFTDEINVIGDFVFISRDGFVEQEEKDGIIYKYSASDKYGHKKGDVVEAYKVDENNLTYYREDGTKLKSIDRNHIITYYDENEKINMIQDEEKDTYYYDYDLQIIKGYRNNTDMPITVRNGENEYELQQYASSVNFYENGSLSSIHQDENHSVVYLEDGYHWKHENGITTGYNSDEELKSISYGDTETQYYNYEEGLVASTLRNGVREVYYESQMLKSMTNINCESEVTVHDAEGNVYTLNEGDIAFYDEDGNLKSISGTQRIIFKDGYPVEKEQDEER